MPDSGANTTDKWGHISQDEQFLKCKKIEAMNMSAFLSTDLEFDGIPENTIINLLCFVVRIHFNLERYGKNLYI